MKDMINTKQPCSQKTTAPLTSKKYSARRFSPFLWMSMFLFFYFLYTIISAQITQLQLMIFPFLIANMVYSDFALWKYYRGKNKLIIWLVEIGITTGIIAFLF